jgi:hypothetical protein
MKVADLAPLKISDEYFGAGPGCGGVMEFLISHENGVFSAKYNIDVTEPTEKWTVLEDVDKNADWRSIFKSMEREGIASLDIDDGTPPHTFDVVGNLNYATELVVCACTGGRTLRLVHELLLLNDDQLASLRLKYSSFLNPDFLGQLLELMDNTDETSLQLSVLLKRNSDLETAALDLDEFKQVEEVETETARIRREWSLRPFRQNIENIMANWKKDHPETSMNQSFGVRATAGGIRSYLENYVATNSEMPKGIHEFEIKIFSNERRVQINFDEYSLSK